MADKQERHKRQEGVLKHLGLSHLLEDRHDDYSFRLSSFREAEGKLRKLLGKPKHDKYKSEKSKYLIFERDEFLKKHKIKDIYLEDYKGRTQFLVIYI